MLDYRMALASLPKRYQPDPYLAAALEEHAARLSLAHAQLVEQAIHANIQRIRSIGRHGNTTFLLSADDEVLAKVETVYDWDAPAIRVVLEQRAPLSFMVLSGVP